MNNRVLIILLSAFAIAAGCSYLVYRVVGNRLTVGHQLTTTVVVAAKEIPLGAIIHDEDLGGMQMLGLVPKGVLVDRKTAVGRGVTSTLYEGEPIFESRLAAPGSGGGLAATIPAGMRACAVKVDEVVGVAGFVTPGMRVDILISGIPPGQVSLDGPRVKTLLQNIQVLSAGQDIQKDNEGKPHPVQVVNLLVTPEQAEVLSLASNQTKIQLVLRNPLDNVVTQPPGTAVAALYTGNSIPPPKPSGPRTPRSAPRTTHFYSIQIYNGSKQSEAKFATGEEK
jgi:pilus assembly protein CpaB